MSKTKLFAGIVSACAIVALSSPVFAQAAKAPKKKLTYDQAWAVCKKHVDTGVLSWDQHQQRYARGAACMKMYGYKI